MADRNTRARSGQAAIEFVGIYGLIMLPLIFGTVFTAEMYWTWHSMVEFTREGARYAATHCWQGDANNVVNYMQTHAPPVVDRDQFLAGGSAQINVEYLQRDPDSGQLVAFSCAVAGDCSPDCVPDAVNVSVTNYEFRRFVAYVHVPPVVLPTFLTSMPITSNGCDPEQNVCNP
jgi:Flp pilus assembly protein TadG